MRGGGQTGDRETKLRPVGQTFSEKSIRHHPYHPAPLSPLYLPLLNTICCSAVGSSIIYPLMCYSSFSVLALWLSGTTHLSAANNRPSSLWLSYEAAQTRWDFIHTVSFRLTKQMSGLQHTAALYDVAPAVQHNTTKATEAHNSSVTNMSAPNFTAIHPICSGQQQSGRLMKQHGDSRGFKRNLNSPAVKLCDATCWWGDGRRSATTEGGRSPQALMWLTAGPPPAPSGHIEQAGTRPRTLCGTPCRTEDDNIIIRAEKNHRTKCNIWSNSLTVLTNILLVTLITMTTAQKIVVHTGNTNLQSKHSSKRPITRVIWVVCLVF